MTKDASFDRFIELPHDVLSSILAELHVLDLYQCILTCHSWYNTILMISGTISGEQCEAVVYCKPYYDSWYLGELGLYSLFSRPPPVVVIGPRCSQQDQVFHHLSLISRKAPDLKALGL
ncbi:hypothetical protein O0I10_001554 [Lichtheimia ornata]|uniref:F-box domain-containing protein n=1 Tax=Lichtheimia ornata TaxID=688661 RepID=A0AAD7VBF8_9FUNG|nr:uncharacterized protein O0I10_001554 [Lichtheimia ornata]KAJ8662592.1 hypothetical protein O0I10_001554 [Lichtheimia ornata]